ncbi:MAG: DNA polymerase III subunit delta' [Thermodesulfobacteriaceae bacterium]|nr:DNA polymerase III subunit delta' [Thermodesulfobacteriaceae bacterium]MDW8135988.1 DNA polymerase III subunit delta' [Thermodesulfobacterium sp.]
MKVINLREILNQEPAINLFHLALKKERLSQAYLLTGPEGVGKETTAWALLFHLFCEKNFENPCGNCKACKKLLKDSHPDLLKVYPEKKEITIEQIRNIQNFLKYRPLEGKYRIVLIKPAEKMNLQAANALLKSLEEPPSYIIFLLITENFTQLLPTIISRSQIVRFRTLPSEVIKNFLIKKFSYEEVIAETLAKISQGSLGRAIEIMEKGLIEELHTFVKAGFSSSYILKFKVAERFSNLEPRSWDLFFYLLSLWIWKSYLKKRYGLSYPSAFPQENFQKDPFLALKIIFEAKSALEHYANPEIVFYWLLTKIFNLEA